MSNRGILVSIICLWLGTGASSPVLAHCEDARKLCHFGNECTATGKYVDRIRDGVGKNIGSEIWGELQGCAAGSNLEDYGAKACAPEDYVSVGKAVLDTYDHKDVKYCNQLPP